MLNKICILQTPVHLWNIFLTSPLSVDIESHFTKGIIAGNYCIVIIGD